MIEAVVFDMDGLLIDSEPVWDAARQQMAREAGKGWTQADHLACMGISSLAAAAYVLRRLELNATLEQVRDRVIEHMLATYRRGIPYMPGAVSAVEMAARHYPVAIASGSHRVLLDVVTADKPLQGKFQAILCSDEVGPGKPAPDVYLEAARRLGVGPDHCLCLEDSASGIQAGRAAGMKVIAVPDPRFPTSTSAITLADLVLPSLCDLSLELLRSL